MPRPFKSFPITTIALLILLGGIVTTAVALQTVDLKPVALGSVALSLDEQAYYEYVAPRLESVVTEVEATRVLIEAQSKDVISLARSGLLIESLTNEIIAYGEEHGVPPIFADVHARILDASQTVNGTFEAARTAIRTFNFSGMRELVGSFSDAADELKAIQSELQRIVGVNGAS